MAVRQQDAGGGDTQFFDFTNALAQEAALAEALSREAAIASREAAGLAPLDSAVAREPNLIGLSPRDAARVFFEKGVKGGGFLREAVTRRDFLISLKNELMKDPEDPYQRPATRLPTYCIGSGKGMGFQDCQGSPLAGWGLGVQSSGNYAPSPSITLLKNDVYSPVAVTPLGAGQISNAVQGVDHVLEYYVQSALGQVDVLLDGTNILSYTDPNPISGGLRYGLSAGSTNTSSQNTTIGNYAITDFTSTTTYFSYAFGNPRTAPLSWDIYDGPNNNGGYWDGSNFYLMRNSLSTAFTMLCKPTIPVPADFRIETIFQTWPEGGGAGWCPVFLKQAPSPV
jgi:hypothetical protein